MLYVLFVLIGIVVAGGLSIYAWRHRSATGGTAFAGLMLLGAIWLLAIGLMVLAPTPSSALVWYKASFFSVSAMPVLLLAFVLQYSDRGRWLTPVRLGLLSIVPSITQVAVWTNRIMQDVTIAPEGGLMVIQAWFPGTWFFVHTAYSYGLILLAVIWLLREAISKFPLYRSQAVAIFIGASLLLIVNAAYTLKLLPAKYSVTPFGFILMGVFLSWAIFQYKLFDLAPVARSVVIESMSDGMIVLDAQDRIVDLNPAAQAILDAPVTQAVGQPVASLLRSGCDLAERYRDVPEAQAELSLHRRGRPYYYELRISPLVDQSGRLTGRLIILRDVTQRVQAESQRDASLEALRCRTAELEARNEELDAFAHTVAHDLKNPLGILHGFGNILAQELANTQDEVLRDCAEAIVRTVVKMNTIVDELLLLASVRKMQDVALEALDMANIVAQAQECLAPMIEKYHAEILLPEAWPVALGYGPWVEEVWVNYLSNALKYGGRPPRVELGFTISDSGFPTRESQSAIHNPESEIVFWVRDNGPGIAKEDRDRLFSLFTRLDQVRTKGHGLGLSIVRRIVERLGGQVGVESHGVPGQGSVFSFSLPAAKPPLRGN
ncbi:MAG: PAS domain-containing protein [Thermoflexales bacterium]|nr:PAS domain-containing protein [Thermoflexales bacterium]